MAKPPKLKAGDRILVRHWDHYTTIEEDDAGVLADAVGYFCGLVDDVKHPMLKMSMVDDLSAPWFYVVASLIERVERWNSEK